jgi:hypothetical protein
MDRGATKRHEKRVCSDTRAEEPSEEGSDVAFAPCRAPPTRYPMLDRPMDKRQHLRLSGFHTSSACSLRCHRDRGVAVCHLRAP